MLITEAPLATASAIASPEAEQVISPSVPGAVLSGTLSARAPGQTPRMPIPFCGAAATDIVAVPCELVTGVPGIVAMFGSLVHSGWVTSAAASTSAISGLCGVTGGGIRSGAAILLRQSFGAPESGSSGMPFSGLTSVLAWA